MSQNAPFNNATFHNKFTNHSNKMNNNGPRQLGQDITNLSRSRTPSPTPPCHQNNNNNNRSEISLFGSPPEKRFKSETEVVNIYPNDAFIAPYDVGQNNNNTYHYQNHSSRTGQTTTMSQTDSFTTNHSGHSRLAGPRRSTQDANNTHNTSRYYLCQTAYSDDDGNASSSSLEDVSPIKGLYEENTSHCQYSLDQSSSLPQRREVSYGGPTPMNPPLTLVPHLATNDNAPLRHQTSAGEPESVLIDSQISNRLNESWNDVAKQLYQMP